PGPGCLLAGWLMDRTGLPPSALTLRRTVHASMTLAARSGGRRAAFCVTRPGDEEVVHSWAEVGNKRRHSESVSLPEHGLTWSLAEALSHLEPDPVYQHAIRSALAL
ncbi:MAG: OpcA/G6PD domain-containing protein, partial [Acidimicrobiales bacterium]